MMRKWLGGIFLASITSLVFIAAVLLLGLWYFIPAPPSSITIAAAVKGGPVDQFAHDYRDRLARHGVTLNIRFVESGVEDLDLIEEKTSGVDAAFFWRNVQRYGIA